MIKIRTSLKNSLIESFLFKGSLAAFLGITMIILGGAFFPLDLLDKYGIFVFLLGGTLIAAGMLPYRRLCRLETNPSELHLTEKTLDYIERKKHILSIPLGHIFQMSYIERKNIYGIGIKITGPLPKKINQRSNLLKTGDQYGFDLFFPYFSQRSYSLLKEQINLPDQSSDKQS